MLRAAVVAGILFLCLIMVPWSDALGQDVSIISLSNEYVRVFVNVTGDATGRFALDTTGGDPTKADDDGKPLIYGRPVPWTSYTTIRIDGKDYCYGGPTEKRAGRHGLYGDMVKGPEIVDNREIQSSWRLGDSRDIDATQCLKIVRSSTTGLLDTVEIRYLLTNEGNSVRDVGLRIVLDTMLGSNDGAPFRAKDAAITKDTKYDSGDLPQFWQAFDSLSAPSVTSQGTLSGQGATPPDRVYFSNWGSLADGLWDFDFVPGRDFTRSGEYELDSAIALYWDPKPLMPGESREYVTLYGLGGISIAPGALTLGVSSPAEVTLGKGQPGSFPVVCYIENSGKGDAIGVKVTISLPDGLSPVSGQPVTRRIGNLASGGVAQVSWDLVPSAGPGTVLTYSVKVEAENAESNQVERSVRLLGPPRLAVSLEGPDSLAVVDEKWSPVPFGVVATITNAGSSSAYGVKASALWGAGLVPAPCEKSARFLGSMAPGESYQVSWQMEPKAANKSAEYAVRVESRNADESFASGTVTVPELKPKVQVIAPSSKVVPGTFFPVYIRVTNVREFTGGTLDLVYDPHILKAIRVSRGTLFVEGGTLSEWKGGTISDSFGRVQAMGGQLRSAKYAFDVFACVHFRARSAGRSGLSLENVVIRGGNGKEIPVEVVNGAIVVQEK
ncbi:MAG TPA: cellulosome anchor protein [Firmicutes bacterium]|nr:cellulosome anchor protein [Bacillota bacterium]